MSINKSSMKQDKGHESEVEIFVKATEKGGETSPPIPFEQIIEVSKASCLAMDSVETGVYYKL